MFFKGCRSDSSGDSAPCQLFTLPISEKERRAGPAAGPRRMRHSLCSKGMKYFTILQEFSFRAPKKQNRTGVAGVCTARREGAGGRGVLGMRGGSGGRERRRCGEAPEMRGGSGCRMWWRVPGVVAERGGSGGRRCRGVGAGRTAGARNRKASEAEGCWGCGEAPEAPEAGGVGVWEQGGRRIRARREGIECRRRRNEARGKAGTGRAARRSPGACGAGRRRGRKVRDAEGCKNREAREQDAQKRGAREPENRCTGTENHRNSPGSPQIRRKSPKIITLA